MIIPKPKLTRKNLARAGWLFMALLFIVTGLGVGVVSFFQSTGQQDTNSTTNQTTSPKLRGTKLTGFEPVAKVDSLQIIDLTSGTGAEVKPGAKITAQYTGAVASTGTIFESSIDSGQPITDYPLSNLIEGWQQGLVGMKVNGQRRLLIPAAQAYGTNSPSPDIPPNSDLVFDVILLDTK